MSARTSSSNSIPWMFAGLEKAPMVVITPTPLESEATADHVVLEDVAPSTKSMSSTSPSSALHLRTSLQMRATTTNRTECESRKSNNNISGNNNENVPWMFRNICQDDRLVMPHVYSHDGDDERDSGHDGKKFEGEKEEEPTNIMRNISNNSNRSSSSNYHQITIPEMRHLSNAFNNGVPLLLSNGLNAQTRRLSNGGLSIQSDGAWIAGGSPWVGLKPFYQSPEREQPEEESGRIGVVRRQLPHEEARQDLYCRSHEHRADEFRKALVPMDLVVIDLSFRFEDDDVSALGHDAEAEQFVIDETHFTSNPPMTLAVAAACYDSLSHVAEDGSSVLLSAAPNLVQEEDEDDDDDDDQYEYY